MAEAKAAPIEHELNPLTNKDLQDLKTAKSALGDVISTIEAAEQCGTDCQQFRQLVEMLGARIDAMENTYFSQPLSK
tara:strand:- start:638 stop:868 length:231 start_codon:yes stop_codon:yes gene_type:complete